MLTINHVEENGAESICQAKTISFSPDSRTEILRENGKLNTITYSSGPTLMALHINGVEEESLNFVNGSVYVVNESGKTVARYDLDGIPRYSKRNNLPPAPSGTRKK